MESAFPLRAIESLRALADRLSMTEKRQDTSAFLLAVIFHCVSILSRSAARGGTETENEKNSDKKGGAPDLQSLPLCVFRNLIGCPR